MKDKKGDEGEAEGAADHDQGSATSGKQHGVCEWGMGSHFWLEQTCLPLSVMLPPNLMNRQ